MNIASHSTSSHEDGKAQSFLNDLGPAQAEAALDAISSSLTIERIAEDHLLARSAAHFLKVMGPGVTWSFFKAAERVNDVHAIANEDTFRFAKAMGRRRAELYYKTISDAFSTDSAKAPVLNSRSVSITGSIGYEASSSFFSISAGAGMSDMLSSADMLGFSRKAGPHTTELLLKAVASSRLQKETLEYYIKMSKEYGGIEAMRMCGILYDQQFARAAHENLGKGSFMPDRYIAVMSIYNVSWGEDELRRMLAEEGYAMKRLDSSITECGIADTSGITTKEKITLLHAGREYMARNSAQINKFVRTRKSDNAFEEGIFGFDMGKIRSTFAIDRIDANSGRFMFAYTVKGKANILNISSRDTACCAFLPKGSRSWAAVGYANDPAVILINFKAGNQKGNIAESSPNGVAICSLASISGAGPALYVNSIEGGRPFSEAVRGHEIKIAEAIDDYAKSINADSALFNSECRNETPKRFSESIRAAHSLVIPVSEIKLLARNDSYFEKGNTALKLIR